MLLDELFRECEWMLDVDLDLMCATGGLCDVVRSMYALCLEIGSEGSGTREKGAELFKRFSAP